MRPSSYDRLESLLRQVPKVPNSVLEVGCGAWEDRPTLVKCYPAARLLGVDMRPPVENGAPGFVQADIRRLPFAAPFDLVLIRHPDVHRSRAAWEKFFRKSGRWLTPGGVLLITTYSAAEVEVIRAWLPPLPAVPLDPGQLAPVALDGQDRYYFALVRALDAVG